MFLSYSLISLIFCWFPNFIYPTNWDIQSVSVPNQITQSLQTWRIAWAKAEKTVEIYPKSKECGSPPSFQSNRAKCTQSYFCYICSLYYHMVKQHLQQFVWEPHVLLVHGYLLVKVWNMHHFKESNMQKLQLEIWGSSPHR